MSHLSDHKESVQKILEIQSRLLLSLGEAQPLETALRHLSEVSGADRIYLYEWCKSEEGVKVTAEFQEGGILQYIVDQQHKTTVCELLPKRWVEEFEAGRPIMGMAENFPHDERGCLLSKGIVSILAVPIRLGADIWGFLELGYSEELYEWDEAMVESLRIVAPSFAAASMHHRQLQHYAQIKKIMTPDRPPYSISASVSSSHEGEHSMELLSDISTMIHEYRRHLDAQTLYELLYQKASDAILIIHNDLFVDANEAALNMLGVSSMDEVLCILNHHPSSLSPEFQPDGRLSYEKTEESCRFEWLFNRVDGSELWVDTMLTRIADGEDEIIHVSWRDISIRKEFEADLMRQKKELVTLNNDLGNKTTQLHMLYKRLEYSQKYQKAIFDGQPNMIIANFNTQTLCDGNKAFLDFVGYPDVPSFLAEHECICDFFIEKEGYLFSKMEGKEWTEYIKENPDLSHYALMKRGEKEYVFSVSVNEVNIENDNINIASFSDITELEEYKHTLEKKIRTEVIENRKKDRILHNQSKSIQMGEMLNMIAHQWRQPLNAISASAISVSMKLELEELEPDDIREHLTYIQWRVQKMSQTISDFMNFFKPDQEAQSFTLAEVMHEIESLMRAQLQGRGIELLYDDANPLMMYSYKKELAHVLINLIANARDAYEGKHINTKTIHVTLFQKKSNYFCISVTDQAGGIDPENLDKIFNPYFTAKEQGKGTGIGLYMSKRIVSEILNGTIEVLNRDNGVEFMITFKNNKTE